MPSGNGGVGILINSPGYTQNRLDGCYLDYNDLVVVDPEHVTVLNTFFLMSARLVIKASKSNHAVNGLAVIGNEWDCSCDPGTHRSIYVDQSEASFTSIKDVTVSGNMVQTFGSSQGVHARATRVTLTQAFNNTNSVTFDFTDYLVFGKIQSVLYSMEVSEEGVFVRHASRAPVGGTVVKVEMDAKASGVVTMTVDENLPN